MTPFGHIDGVKILISKNANIKATDSRLGMTALLSAVSQNKTGAVKALLDGGAKINARMKDRRTALMLATLLGYFDTVKLLLERGAEVNVRDNAEYTALSLAIAHEIDDIVEILKKAGAVEGKNIKSNRSY